MTQHTLQGMSAKLSMPSAWFDVPLPPLESVTDASSALKELQGVSWVPPTDEEPGTASFAAGFWGRLRGSDAHVLVDYPADVSALRAATLIAGWMGVPPEAVHEHIGGTVSHVISGAGHRHDQSWHTDSTPWEEPNRYSILGFLNGAANTDASTDLQPIDALQDILADDPAALGALRHEDIAWRRNFPLLPALQAPILDPQTPRWVWPVLEQLLDEMSDDLRRGTLAVAQLINELPHQSPVVAPGRLLVFDNWRALHRGPHLDTSSRRELVRIKVGGRALP